MKKALLIIFLSISATCLKAQVGISYLHSDVIGALGVSTNPDKKIWGEARLSLDVDVHDFSPALLGFANLIRRDDFNFFLGAGIDFHVWEGLMLPVGFTVKPIESKPNLAIHTEGTLIVRFSEGGEIVQGSIGLRYYIRKKEKGN